jgi:DNA polymerase I-like protein with 3'-5' exonuclease and polymerase domains
LRLFEAFCANPKTDPHIVVTNLVQEYAGVGLSRKHAKITSFGIMYGRGIPALSAALGVSAHEAGSTREAYYAALPEIRDLSAATRNRGRSGLPIRTWGGRLYYKEPNPDRDLSYKLLNYLIQGSGADQTKQAIIDWHDSKSSAVLLAAVHDEINISSPAEATVQNMEWLRSAMDAPRFDVPFASEGFAGPNWADIVSWTDS